MKPNASTRALVLLPFLLLVGPARQALAQSVTSRWATGAIGGWEGAANWDKGVPLAGTNVVIGISSNAVVTFSNPVSYAVGRLFMTNTVGGSGTNTLLINTNGFTTVGATLFNGQIVLNPGGVWTNGSGVAGSGSGASSSTLTVNGGTYVQTNGSWGSSAASQTPKMQLYDGLIRISGTGNASLQLTMTGGVFHMASSGIPRMMGTLLFSGGVFSNTSSSRLSFFGVSSTATVTNDASIVTTGFSMDAGAGNGIQVFNMSGGSFQITSNAFWIGNSADNSTKTPGGRKALFNQYGGEVSMTNAAGLVFDQEDTGGTGNTNRYSLQGGTLNLPKITFFGPNATQSLNILEVRGGTLNLGSGGIVSNQPNGAATYEIWLSGGTVGAQESWSSVLNMGLTNTGGGAVTFRAADTNGVAKDITLSGALTGNGGFIKTGGGTLALNGASSFGGNAVVSNGTLRVNGALSGAGALAVASNATLGGTGSLRAVTLADGGTLAPGNSIGTLTVSNLTLGTGSLFDFELAATNGSDQVVDLGTLTLAQLGFSNFTFTTNAGFGLGTYVLVDAAAHLGSFTTVVNSSFFGYQGTLLLGGVDGNDLLLSVALPIPEPSTAFALAAGIAALAIAPGRRA